MTDIPIRRALLSVANKDGLVEFAAALQRRGIVMLSTGGTAALLRQHGISVTEVSAHTGFPEIMDGRVKTLHPAIHGGLLARRGIDDEALRTHDIDPIDLLVVNLYPFAQTVAKADCSYADAIENIDIGGPAMVRAAAKNHDRVTVIVEPIDYSVVLAQLQHGSAGVSATTRQRLAAKAFAHTAGYDAAVASYLARMTERTSEFPQSLTLHFRKQLDLRYGENPHQSAAFYAPADSRGTSIGTARQLQGKTLSYNNLSDGDTALECVRQYAEPACVIVKHANPCGAAVATDAFAAYDRAYRTDPTSAFGGIIAFNRPLSAATARAIIERQFVELIIAPSIDDDALAVCAPKENLRILATGNFAPSNLRHEYRSVNGGLLVQTRDDATVSQDTLQWVTRRQPSATEIGDLMFAWQVCKYVKSNAIVYARERTTIGVGAGQTSRVVASRIAAMKAQDAGLVVAGAVMASDAFFPFRDGVDVAADYGITAVIQPGGSVRDKEVIAAADEHGMAMALTGMRHFRH